MSRIRMKQNTSAYLYILENIVISSSKIAEKWPNWDHHNIFTYIVEWFLSVYSISAYIGRVFYVRSLRIDTYSIIYEVQENHEKSR